MITTTNDDDDDDDDDVIYNAANRYIHATYSSRQIMSSLRSDRGRLISAETTTRKTLPLHVMMMMMKPLKRM